MPVNRGRGQTTRWYKICFVPTSADSSDDSDTESIILAHAAPTTTTTPPELSPPVWSPPPTNPEPQIDWRFPPPPPPPPDLEPQINSRLPPPQPPPPDIEPQINSRLPPPPPDLEPQLNSRLPPPPPDLVPQINSRLQPPPPPPPPALDGEPEIDSRFPPPPPPPLDREHEIDWRFPPPPPPPPNTEPQIDRRFPPPRPRSPSSRPQENIWGLLAFDIELRHDRYQHQQQQQPQSPSHQVFEADQQSVNLQLQVPVDVISRVRISELHEIENLSHSHCPICLEEFKVGDRACRLPCIHTYCSECILLWLSNNKTCPVCRLQLDDWETPCDSYSIGDDDDHGLETETEILQIHQPILTNSSAAWELLFTPVLSSSVIEDGAGYNSEIISDYDSACDELGDSHGDGDNIVGASLSGCC